MKIFDSNEKILYQFYADDLVLIGKLEDLTTVLAKMEEWCENNNMVINKSKSGLMRMKGRILNQH
jgi:hypothetical protein